jgi:Tc toxin complex TcA C-terminal TcB-binding domain
MFDLDYPGLYLRRIKNVAMSIPCVASPYVGVHCRLQLLKSSIRYRPLLPGPEDCCCPRPPAKKGKPKPCKRKEHCHHCHEHDQCQCCQPDCKCKKRMHAGSVPGHVVLGH